MDEKPYQLLDDVREPLPMRSGDIQKTDPGYIRKGTSSIFVFTEVLAGWRHVSAREHCTATDWAEEICYLLEECYPDKEKLIIVMDNLNTHALSSLYKSSVPYTKATLQKKQEPWQSVWRSITHRNTEADLTLRRSN